MIKTFVARWEQNKGRLEAAWRLKRPDSYLNIVKEVVKIVGGSEEDRFSSDETLDVKRIKEVDWGDYQGTLLYVIGEAGSQPNRFYTVKVGYGSCSGCDTLKAIHGYSDEPPTDSQMNDYMTLALHVVQGLREVNGGSCD